ncbi:hypothetical protein TWF694_000841 [Orbilia ellipsospora]|uniref:Uncharacterized protein n=1 Tax=Orbilia ellipsospora TaxID=2528407 RepID=A0AAV9XPZ6_9PEZI
MADPSIKKTPIVETGSSPAVDPRAIMTPVYSTPAQSVAGREPAPPPMYAPGTVHRPPPSISPSDHGNPSEPDDDYKTININITIKVPSSFHFPCWRRCKRRHQDPPPPSHSIQGIHARDGIPRAEKRRRFLAVVVAIFYLSFIICGAVAWGIKDRAGIWTIPQAPLILETFAPFLDVFVLYSTIIAIKRHQENDKPGFRWFILLVLNVGLFVLHLVVLIFAAIWAENAENYLYWRGRYWHMNHNKIAVAGLMLYNTSTLILIKFILFIAIMRKRSLRQKFSQSVTSIPEFIGQEYRYHSLTGDVDDDATGIENARNPTDQRGRVYLD